ncbi:hypothetical protein [Parasitella parasitica]|uniref:Importin N-terminal domain-containing protein n=1 Tax=Parasitella parasitica TaxID=35722 RepID=A0A0B7NGR7_9FUNG|nr:hypothetical protein [Parasitella parasitica]
MAEWEPQQQGLRELLFLLGEAANSNSRDQGLTNQRLSSFNEYPDYNSYLAYILTKLSNGNVDTRIIAGLHLKNNIKNHFNNIPLTVLDYVKQCCIDIIESPQPAIAKAVSSVIAAIVQSGQVHNWIQVIRILIGKLDAQQPATALHMAFDTIAMICENAACELDQEISGVRPLEDLIPKLIEFYSSSDPTLRVQAIHATSQFVLLKPASFVEQLDSILAALYTRLSDDDPRVRQELGRILAVILEAFPHKLEPYLCQVIEYMVKATADQDPQISLGACDFWIQYAQSSLYRQKLIAHLPKLIAYLLQLMVYSDADLLNIGHDHHIETATATCINKLKILEDQNIQPRYYRPKNQPGHPTAPTATQAGDGRDELSDLEEESVSSSSSEEGDEGIESIGSHDSSDSDIADNEDQEDFDDEDFYSEDSLRKCSAAALEALSVSFGDDITPILLNCLSNETLVHENWLVRESGILALGAAAEGGIQVISHHLHRLIPFLLTCMEDSKPLVRSISCWAISRFSNWLAEQYDTDEESRKRYFEAVLFQLLRRLLDPNQRVQESACTALIILGEIASIRLIPYIYPILTQTNSAFALYRRKNRLILYDALGTVADAVGPQLNQPQFIYLLMPPLINKWNELSDKDTDLFPLLECLSNITAALGPGFIQYVEPVLSRCVKLISSTLQEQMLADQYPDEIIPPNVEFLIAALDLLSGIVQGLGPAIEPLIAQTNPPLIALLQRCIHDPVSEVLQSTFALIGDIAIACFQLLVPFLHDMIVESIQILRNGNYMISFSVYNNALWAVGEIVMRLGSGTQPYVRGLMDVFIPLLAHPQAPASIHENAMIALGRLGLACPQHVAPYLRLFVKPWLEKSLSVREGDEKDSAFRGLCAVIKFNAQDAQEELYSLLIAISSLKTQSKTLLTELNDVVRGFRGMATDDEWNYITTQLDPNAYKYIMEMLTEV